MILKLSDHFKIASNKFEALGVFDAFVDIDTTLFVDPHLLKQTNIPEFKNSYHTCQAPDSLDRNSTCFM